MSWGGKVVGAGVGAVLGGPLGAAVGAGLGAVWDDVFGEDGRTAEFQRVQFDTGVTSLGPGIRWLMTFRSSAPIGVDCILVVRFKVQGVYIRAATEEYADDDGDLGCAGPVEFESNRASGVGLAIVPALAFGSWPSSVEVEGNLVGSDGTIFAQGTAEFDWPTLTEVEDSSLIGALIYSCVGMVCSSGKLDRSEVQALRAYLVAEFELEAGADASLKRMLKRARERRASPQVAAEMLRPHFVDDMARPVLDLLYSLASTDGTVSANEDAWILQFCRVLGIGESDRAAVRGSHTPDLDRYRKVLGVGVGASKAELKRAYRREAADYHPDKVGGLPSGFRDFATQRMKELNEAYKALSAAL